LYVPLTPLSESRLKYRWRIISWNSYMCIVSPVFLLLTAKEKFKHYQQAKHKVLNCFLVLRKIN
jgi:hypothetical protein